MSDDSKEVARLQRIRDELISRIRALEARGIEEIAADARVDIWEAGWSAALWDLLGMTDDYPSDCKNPTPNPHRKRASEDSESRAGGIDKGEGNQ